MDLDKVTFLWSSEEITKRGNEYWSRVLEIARKNSLTRIKRCVAPSSFIDSFLPAYVLFAQMLSNYGSR